MKSTAVDQAGLVGVELAAGDDVIMDVDDQGVLLFFFRDVSAVLLVVRNVMAVNGSGMTGKQRLDFESVIWSHEAR